MSRRKKILIILQLCFSFTYFTWLLIQPNIKNTLAKKTKRSLYEMVFEKKSLFETLEESDRTLLIEGYKTLPLKDFSQRKELYEIFFHKTPSFAVAWLFFSFLLSFLLLFEIEGAKQVVWILPALVVCLAFSLYGKPENQQNSPFPSENYVLSHYIKENETFPNQRERLLKGWHRYLIAEWAKERPSLDEESFQKQLEKGLFAFNVERLKCSLLEKKEDPILAGFLSGPSFFRILLYFIWNVIFAWVIMRPSKSRAISIESL